MDGACNGDGGGGCRFNEVDTGPPDDVADDAMVGGACSGGGGSDGADADMKGLLMMERLPGCWLLLPTLDDGGDAAKGRGA